MNFFEMIDYNLQLLNTAHLINSIIRSSIVIIFGIVALIILYFLLPQKIQNISNSDLNSLREKQNLHIILGIIGFFILGTTGYAYVLSVALKIYYPGVVSLWVNISFIFLTSLCIKCYKYIKFGLIPIIIGFIGFIGGVVSLFLLDMNPVLGFVLELIALSFLPSLSVWFLQIKIPTYAQKITLIFGILLLTYGIIKLSYFIVFIIGIQINFLEFLYSITPTLLDVICIFGPIACCFLKCESS